MSQRVICLLGHTCTGKDTLAEKMQEMYPDKVGLIQVGKIMRERHPPEYFKGLGALEETEPETWEIFDQENLRNISKEVIVVIGMPRLKGQCAKLIQRHRAADIDFYLMTADDNTIYSRMVNRFNQQPGWFDLAKQRLINDKAQAYDVFTELFQFKHIRRVIDTTGCLQQTANNIYYGFL